jgi:hypothetical protein
MSLPPVVVSLPIADRRTSSRFLPDNPPPYEARASSSPRDGRVSRERLGSRVTPPTQAKGTVRGTEIPASGHRS